MAAEVQSIPAAGCRSFHESVSEPPFLLYACVCSQQMVQKTKTWHKEKDGGSGADGSTSVLAKLKTRRSRWIVRNDDAAGLRPAYAHGSTPTDAT